MKQPPHCPWFKRPLSSWIGETDWMGRRMVFLLMVMAFWMALPAQKPVFRNWNVGAAIGFSPINGNSLLPTLTGHYLNLSAEVSPYPFSPGISAGYHFSPLPFLKKGRFSIDVAGFFARENANWYKKFPWAQSFRNVTRMGVTAGGSFYCLRRFALVFAFGVQYVNPFGPEQLNYNVGPRSYFLETGALGIHFRLFKTFEP